MWRKPRRLPHTAGFSLVELMVITAIIGILTTLAYPKFKRFQVRAKQSEVKSNLGHLYTLEMTYFGEYGVYGNTTSSIGFDAGPQARYTYLDPTVSGTTFTATATFTTLCIVGDEWTIDHLKSLEPNASKNCALND